MEDNEVRRAVPSAETEDSIPQETDAAPQKSVVKKPAASGSGASSGKKKKKKKKKRRKTAGQIIMSTIRTVFLVAFLLCLLLIGLAVYLFFGFSKDSCTTDSYTKLIQAQPMSVSERFDIDPDNASAVMRMDKKDLWWFIITQKGTEFIEETKASFQAHGFRLAGYGINLSEDSSIDLDIRWNSIKTVAHIPLAISFENSSVTVKPTGVRILKLNLSPEMVKFLTKIDLEPLAFSLELKSGGFIQSFDSMSISGDVMSFGISLDSYPLRALSPAAGYPEAVSWFADSYEPVLSAAALYEESPDLAMSAFLSGCDTDPELFEERLTQYFTLVPLKDSWTDFRDNGGFITERVLFGTSEDSFRESHDALMDYCEGHLTLAGQFLTTLTETYNKVKITPHKDGYFLYKKEKLIPSALATEEEPWDNCELFMPQEDIRFVLMDTENAWRGETPALKKFISSTDVFTSEMDKSVSYPIAYAARTTGGSCFLCYMTRSENSNGEAVNTPVFRALTQEEYDSLNQEGKIFVFR